MSGSITQTTSEELLTSEAKRASLCLISRSSVSVADSSARATCDDSARSESVDRSRHLLGGRDDHQAVQLVLDEQRRHEHGAVVVDGQGERLAQRALVGPDHVGVVVEQSLPLPFLQGREREVRAVHVGAAAGSGDDHERRRTRPARRTCGSRRPRRRGRGRPRSPPRGCRRGSSPSRGSRPPCAARAPARRSAPAAGSGRPCGARRAGTARSRRRSGRRRRPPRRGPAGRAGARAATGPRS